MCCNDKFIEHLNAINGLHDFINSTFFESTLSKPVITIQRNKKEGVLGWFAPWEAWQTETETSPEINISADYLDRKPLDLAETLLHKMIHQCAYERKIQDCSRSGTYHNKQFKQIAEAHGLTVTRTKSGGWNATALTEESALKLSPILPSLAALKRVEGMKLPGKSSSTRKYICPECGISVRATKQVAIMCMDCETPMQEE